MSLFDVIKYPISFPPTVEELNNLPEDMYSSFRHGFPEDWPVDRIVLYMHAYPNVYKWKILELRQKVLDI